MTPETTKQLKAAILAGDLELAAKLMEEVEEVSAETPKKRGRPKKTAKTTAKTAGKPVKKTTKKVTKKSPKKIPKGLKEKSPDEFPELPRYDARKHGVIDNLFVDDLQFALFDEDTGEVLLQDKKPPPRKSGRRINFSPEKCRCAGCGKDFMVAPALAPKGDQDYTCNRCYGKKKGGR